MTYTHPEQIQVVTGGVTSSLGDKLDAMVAGGLANVTAPGAGAVARTVSDKFADVVNVKDYGALADWNGTTGTDLGPPLLAAIAVLPSTGGKVIIPAGAYFLGTSVATTRTAIVIEGAGGSGWIAGGATQIFTTGAIIAFDFGSASATDHRGPQVRGLSINDASLGGAGGSALGAFRVRRMNHPRFDDVTVNNFLGGYAFTIDGGADAVILPMFLGVRIKAALFGIVQAGAVTAMWVSPTCYFGAPTPNTGSIAVQLTGDTTYFSGVIDHYETGIKIAGESHKIIGARFESVVMSIWVAGPIAKRNIITANTFSNGGTVATIQIDSSATILETVIANNIYSVVGVGIVDNSAATTSSYIFEPQQNLIKERRLQTGAAKQIIENLRTAGAATDTAEWVATSNGITAALQSFGDGTTRVGSITNHDFYVVANNAVVKRFPRGGPVSIDRGDTSQTLTVGLAIIQRWMSTLTANRTITLSTTGAVKGDRFRIVRSGLGAFTLDVGGLKTVPASTAAFVDVSFDGTAWFLTGYGTL